jgi:hypothetical protein
MGGYFTCGPVLPDDRNFGPKAHKWPGKKAGEAEIWPNFTKSSRKGPECFLKKFIVYDNYKQSEIQTKFNLYF